MLRGLYTAGSGMIAQQRRQEMLTNNMSNLETPGYKADQSSLRKFPNMIATEMSKHNQPFSRPQIGELTTGVYMQDIHPNFRQGDVQETGNSTDAALFQSTVPETEDGGPALLAYEVQNDDGDIRYTRTSSFTVDGAGLLTTNNGHYVLGTDGEPIEAGSEEIVITDDGTVTDTEGIELGQLNVALIPDPSQLVKEGGDLLRYDGEEAIGTAVGNDEAQYQIQQGFVERSNVDPRQTMTELMTTMRTFELNQKALQAYDQSLERTVNDVGRIQ
ncbi:flagellar hook-basal body protein [Alkalicoccus urumqiensis]|uniref:Flagellar biosynthesis protein FlgC n=1 Tax=Alkalicoccus urumqiensis TaxID=1548213 RepID=A0A2P6MHL2_ALKUR|nr:flagellar hook-basal body protein [Alkalicoccus urumqiensis]PRO65776.1 flagellar biosynthesis protein FlgC [Alkalicoccus urumqiensis]